MAQQNISIGNAANDGTGDAPRVAAIKINANFAELYAASGSGALNVIAATGSTTLALNTDILEVNSSVATTITVPTNATVVFPIGTQIEVFQLGVGTPTVTPAVGVTFQPATVASPVSQYRSVFLRKRDTNTWTIA